MKISKPILIIIGFIVVAGVLFIASRNKTNGPAAPSPAGQSSKWETKTSEQAAVTVEVTPVDLSQQASEWKFDVVLNTHSVELNQDMAQVAALVDDQGKQYQPLAWEGAAPGGHHREGSLIFKPITPTPKSLELKISNIGDAGVRSFAWQIQ